MCENKIFRGVIMAQELARNLVDVFSGLTSLKYGKELIVFIICFIGNIIPIPFILWFITPIFDRLKKTKLFSGMVGKLENKAMKKKDKIEKLEYIGLLLFVGIPLPGTGAWTGSLIASLLNMDKKKSLVYAILGVVLAGIIMMVVSFGILDNLIH